MSSSSYYEKVKQEEKRLIFEDDVCGVFLAEPPSTLGHLKIVAKKDGPFSERSEEEAERMFLYASLGATALFEFLGAHGSNIIMNEWIRNGPEPHAILHVLARFQEDDLNFQWQPQKQAEDMMKMVQQKIRDKTFILTYKEPKKEIVNLDEKPDIEEIEGKVKEYFRKRVP